MNGNLNYPICAKQSSDTDVYINENPQEKKIGYLSS